MEEIKKTVPKLPSKSETTRKSVVRVQSRTPSTTAEAINAVTETKHAKTTVKFCFTMESFVIDLLSSVDEVLIIFIDASNNFVIWMACRVFKDFVVKPVIFTIRNFLIVIKKRLFKDLKLNKFGSHL